MKREYYVIMVAVVAVLLLVSCKRKHLCYCVTKGSYDTVVVREYRGYKKDEAQKVCMSDNYASTSALDIECNIR